MHQIQRRIQKSPMPISEIHQRSQKTKSVQKENQNLENCTLRSESNKTHQSLRIFFFKEMERDYLIDQRNRDQM